MSLELDERQRAMLAEMGVQVWLPERDEPGAPDAPDVAVAAPLPARPAPTAPTPAPAAVQRDAPRAAPPRAAVADANGVDDTGDAPTLQPADWMIVGEAAGDGEDLPGDPLAGQADRLLDNMLRAMGLSRGLNVFIASAPRSRAPADVARHERELQQQLVQVQPRVILAMGRAAAQALLQTPEPLGRLRGQVHQFRGVPVVVTYPPAYLLRNPADKAKAWADLCLALGLMQPAG